LKKISLFIMSLVMVFLLTACDTYDFSYTFYETKIEIGADVCYASGSDVSVDPIIHMGYTYEDIEEDNDDYDTIKYQWMIQEVIFILDKVVDGENVLVDSKTITIDLNEDQYEEKDNTSSENVFDYSPYINDDVFDLGSLEDGTYYIELQVYSRYMDYKKVTDADSSSARDTSAGVNLHFADATKTFTVGGDCTVTDFDGLLVYKTVDNRSSLLFYGYDNEGNQLTRDDIVLFDAVLVTERDYSSDMYRYYDTFDEYRSYYRTIDEYTFNNVSRVALNNVGPNDTDNPLTEEYTTYAEEYFDFDQWNQVLYTDFLYEVDEADDHIVEDYYFTVKLKGTNVYKDILIIFDEDTTAPVFTNVPEDQTIDPGEALDIAALTPTATDNVDGDITDRVTADITDTTQLEPGDHVVTYSVRDFFGNEATASFTVTVLPEDTTPPVVTVFPHYIEVEIGNLPTMDSFTITAIDDRDGEMEIAYVMISMDPEYNQNVPGTYVFTYSISDAAGNIGSDTLTVVVLAPDETAPVITINGDLPTVFSQGDTEPDYTTYFSIDDETNGMITVDNSMLSWDTELDLNVPGNYTLTITVSDAAGNTKSEQIVFTVQNEYPSFNDIPSDQTITQGDTLDLLGLGLTSYDEEDGDLTSSIAVDIMDTSVLTPGTYTVTYSVTDSVNQTTTVTIVLTVETPLNLVPVFDDIPTDQTITEGDYLDLLDLGLTALDGEDGDVTMLIMVDIVDTSILVPDTYTVTYSVTDSDNNTVTTTIQLTVEPAESMFTGAVWSAVALTPNDIAIVFDVFYLDNFVVDNTAFTVVIDGIPATITNIDVLFDSITITVSDMISLNSVVTVTYAATGTDDLEFDMVKVPDFTDEVVDTTMIDSGSGMYTGEIMVAWAIDANTIEISFDVDTFDLNFIDETAFTVLIDGVEATITFSFVNINTVTLTITETMDEFTFVEVSYSPTGNSDLSYGGVLIAAFTNEPVLPPSGGGFPGF